MSRRRETIELIAPERISQHENFMSRIQQCRYCNGQGWHWSGERDPEKRPCPDCGGTGRVRALVAVTWVPAGEIIYPGNERKVVR